MKDPALAVLQEQLPEEIRPLAISLLTSEQEGMKQFEHAIQKIASEVQGLDRSSTARTISYLSESIDALHAKLASIDRKTSEWAKRNLAKVTLETEEIDPQDAAREVVGGVDQFEWIPDTHGITPEFARSSRTRMLCGFGRQGERWAKTSTTSMRRCRNSWSFPTPRHCSKSTRICPSSKS